MARERRQPADYVTCKLCGKDFRAITAFHLRNIHGSDGEHPVNDYKRRFRLQTATCLKSRKLISAAKQDFWGRRGQHWTRATLLAEIRRVHRAGRSLRPRAIPVRLYLAGRRLFGTWQAAVGKAGLSYEEAFGLVRWTPDKVIVAIRLLAKRGVPLSASHVWDHYPTLYRVAVKRFPFSWAKALQAAGFDPDEHKKPRGRWNRRGAEEWLRNRAAKSRPILARDAPRDLLGFVHTRLGIDWVEFVELLGIPYPGIKKRRDWTSQKLLTEIRKRKRDGHRLNYRAVKLECQALIHQARKYFGSWDRARTAAGV
jgi:hypothetical protein